MVERLELVVQIAGAAAAGDRLVEDASARHLFDVLPEVSNRQLLWHRYLAVVGRLFADDHPEEGRLAGAIRTDEADFFAGIQLEGSVDEEDLPAVLLADPRKRDHPQRDLRPAGVQTARPPSSRCASIRHRVTGMTDRRDIRTRGNVANAFVRLDRRERHRRRQFSHRFDVNRIELVRLVRRVRIRVASRAGDPHDRLLASRVIEKDAIAIRGCPGDVSVRMDCVTPVQEVRPSRARSS